MFLLSVICLQYPCVCRLQCLFNLCYLSYLADNCISRSWLCYLLICVVLSFSGESDDDHEELYLAASSARDASSMCFTLLLHTQFHFSLQKQHIYVRYPYQSLTLLLVSVGLACSGPFWKKMESIFGALSPEDISYLKRQVMIEIP